MIAYCPTVCIATYLNELLIMDKIHIVDTYESTTPGFYHSDNDNQVVGTSSNANDAFAFGYSPNQFLDPLPSASTPVGASAPAFGDPPEWKEVFAYYSIYNPKTDAFDSALNGNHIKLPIIEERGLPIDFLPDVSRLWQANSRANVDTFFDAVQCLRALGQMPSPTEIQDHMAMADPNNTGFFAYKDLAQVCANEFFRGLDPLTQEHKTGFSFSCLTSVQLIGFEKCRAGCKQLYGLQSLFTRCVSDHRYRRRPGDRPQDRTTLRPHQRQRLTRKNELSAHIL